jgi:hypothetical protein
VDEKELRREEGNKESCWKETQEIRRREDEWEGRRWQGKGGEGDLTNDCLHVSPPRGSQNSNPHGREDPRPDISPKLDAFEVQTVHGPVGTAEGLRKSFSDSGYAEYSSSSGYNLFGE